MCVDHLARRWGVRLAHRRKHAVFGEGEVEGTPVALGKPRTFMNDSGQGVRYLLARFGTRVEDMVVVYDEMDLPLGTIRLRPRGGAAGHRGMVSIIAEVGSREFPRVRVGIGRPEDSDGSIGHVLGAFAGEEKGTLRDVIARVGDGVDCMLKEGIDAAMNRYN